MDPTKIISNGSFTRLTGRDNWAQWKSDVQIILELNDSWQYVNGDSPLPTEEKAHKTAQDALKIATYCIKMTCDNTNRLIIGDKRDAVAIFKALTATYEGDTPARRMGLRRQLYHLEHDPSQPVSVFLTNVRSLTSELASIGHPLKPDEIRDIILMNLHSSFEVITTLLASLEKNGTDEWTIDSLGTRLAGFEESRGISNPESSLPAALAARHVPHSRRRHQSPAHDNWLNRQNIPGACNRCGHSGHTAAACFRDMPEIVKEQLRSRPSYASANAVTVDPRTPLTIKNLIATVNEGYTISLYKDKGFVGRGDDFVKQITFRDNNMFSEDCQLSCSYDC
jgi:gag-polypeptide of LTR copia-type